MPKRAVAGRVNLLPEGNDLVAKGLPIPGDNAHITSNQAGGPQTGLEEVWRDRS